MGRGDELLMGRPPAAAPTTSGRGRGDDILMGKAAPEQFKGPLDPARLAPVVAALPPAINPLKPIANPAFPSLQETMQYPVAAGLSFLGSRISSGAAPTLKAALEPGDTPLPQLAAQTARGLVLGQPPEPGLDPRTASYEIASRHIQPLMSEQRAEDIDRALLGLPVGSISRYIAGPGGVAMAAEAPFGGVLNRAGELAIAPAARGLGKAVSATGIRQAPIVKDVGQAFSIGFGLGNDVRDELRQMLREMTGTEALLRGETARQLQPYFRGLKDLSKQTKEDPVLIQRRLRDAIERRSVPLLPVEEQRLARMIEARGEIDPALREAVGLERFELGGHLPEAQQLENVAFTKRVAERRLREQLGGTEGTGVAGLRTAPGKRRVASRELTTEELETQLARQIGGKYEQEFEQGQRGFKELGASALIGGERTAERVAHAEFVTKVAKGFGQIETDFNKAKALRRQGYRSMDELRGAPSGFTENWKSRLGHTYLRPDQFEFMEQVNEAFKPSRLNEMRGFRGKALRAISEVPKLWKTYVLLRPGFLSRNMQNNLLLSGIYGAKPWNYAEAVAKFGSSAPKDLAFIREAIKNNVIGTGSITKEITPAIAKEMKRTPGRGIGKAIKEETLRPISWTVRKFRDVNQSAEDISKLALYIHFKSTGMTAAKAAQKTNQVLFRYEPRAFTSFERGVRSTLLPFYAWRRQIVPLLFRTLGERPGSLGQYAAFRQEANVSQGLSPEQERFLGPDVKSRGAFVKPFRGRGAEEGDFEVFPEGFFGLRDVSAMIGQEDRGVSGPVQRLVSDMFPWISITVSMLTPSAQRGDKANIGFDYYRNKQLTNAPVKLPEAAKTLVLLYPDLAEKLQIRVDPKSKLVYGPDRVGVLFRAVGPIPTMLGDIAASDPQAQRRSRAFWSGISSMVRGIKTGKRIERSERKRGRELREQKRYQERFFLRTLRQPQK